MIANASTLLAFGPNALDYRSGHASTLCHNNFSQHCEARAQDPHVLRMNAVPIVS